MKLFKKLTIIFTVVTFFAVTTLLICNYIIASNADGRVWNDVEQVQEHEFALLLGTTPQTRIGRKPSQFFKYRIDATEELYKAGKIKKILISGDENSLDGINEVECMRDSLIARGVKGSDIILDGKGFRTFDSVVRAVNVFNVHSFIVISQKFHNERAIYLAEHLNLDVNDLAGFNAKDATSNMAIMTYIREYFARVKVFFDIIADFFVTLRI